MWEPMMDRVFAEPVERRVVQEPTGDRGGVDTYDNGNQKPEVNHVSNGFELKCYIFRMRTAWVMPT